MNTPTALTADQLLADAIAADDTLDLVWWAQDELGSDAGALLESDREILAGCPTALDYIKARRPATALRLSRRGRIALFFLHRLQTAYRRSVRATAATFAPNFSC